MRINPIIEKEFEYKGYPCVVMFMPWGCYRCGYVGINTDVHIPDIDCHGGITYEHEELFGQDRKDVEIWIGFDCTHAYDARDIEAARKYLADDPERLEHVEYLANLDRRYYTGGEVRTLEFCVEECKKIVDQITSGEEIIMSELKPVRCGCGGEAEILSFENLDNSISVYVSCSKCHTSTVSFCGEQAKSNAVEAWDRAMGAKDINVPNKERTAEVIFDDADYAFMCGNCGYGVSKMLKMDYCPGCGARLEWE